MTDIATLASHILDAYATQQPGTAIRVHSDRSQTVPDDRWAIWSRALRLIGNPITGIVIAVILVADVFTLPAPKPFGSGGSTVRSILTPRFIGCVLYAHVDIAAHETAEGWVVYDDRTSWNELRQLQSEASARYVESLIYGGSRTERSGFWAPVTETSRYELRLREYGVFSETDLQVARRAICDRLTVLAKETGWPYLADLASNASVRDTTKTTILWGGVVHSITALLLLCGLGFSWRGLPTRIHHYRIERTRDERLRRSRCPGCGYDIRGLPNRRCPECAETWTEAEAASSGKSSGSPV